MIDKKYNNETGYLADCLYIYDYIPIIAGISDCFISADDKTITSFAYITKEELDDIIKTHNIVMRDHTRFKLWSEPTWFGEDIN